MIFKPEMAEKVLSGEKTETRRPVNVGQPCRYRVGRSYAVQPGRGKHAIGRIGVVEVREESLREVDDAAAVREGFADSAEFIRYWFELYGSALSWAPVWVVRFRLLHPDDYPLWEGSVRPSSESEGVK